MRLEFLRWLFWAMTLVSSSIQWAGPMFAQEATAVSFQAGEHLQLMQLLQSIEPYRPLGELKGQAILAGSTTMQQLGQSWSTRFKLFHPNVEFSRGADGTNAGLEALAKDPNTIVGISRSITQEDLSRLEAGACKEPAILIAALDPLAVYVHKDNPIDSLTPEQLQKLLGASTDGKPLAATWSDFGVQGPLASQAVRIHHRSETSGTRSFIRTSIVGGKPLAEPVATHTSNVEICKAIAADPMGVGVCGFGDGNDGVKTVPLMLKNQKVPATEQSFLSGAYPMVRPLSLVFDKSLLQIDNGLRSSIVRYILSRDGQAEAIRAGFYPLDPSFIRQELDQILGTQLR